MARLHPALAAVLLCGAAAPFLSAADPVAADPRQRPLFSRLGGLFSGDLPQLDPPGTMKVILRPHFGDLVRRDYMRVETGLRWSFNDNFELSGEAFTYFTHGFGDEEEGNGVGKLRFGAKYFFENFPRAGYETSLALNVDSPVGAPPVDMTDGQHHFAPSFVVQRQSRHQPRLTTYAGMGLDLLRESDVAGTWGFNQPRDDSASVTAGALYDMGQLKWTLSGTYATTAVIGDVTEHFYYLQPGLLWYVPSRFTFNSKTQWIVGFRGRASWGPDGSEFGVGTRVRAEITFRQVMQKLRRIDPGSK
ncbi:MAG: hypothetical protein JNG83_03770 [Opitutaceae bacterium]|nr:hypothetical protein [Opitutaceae bacterium]